MMIYSLTADDIPLLSQWIKKSKSEDLDFLARPEGTVQCGKAHKRDGLKTPHRGVFLTAFRIPPGKKRNTTRKGWCSLFWPARRDSNPRPLESESTAISSFATGGYVPYSTLFLFVLQDLKLNFHHPRARFRLPPSFLSILPSFFDSRQLTLYTFY